MAGPPPFPGKVWLVGAGPGDPDLITARGIRALQNADVVLHDALSHPDLLEHCKQAEIENVGKRYGERSPHQSIITKRVIEHALQGKRVVRLKGGDPMLFARGGEEALALSELAIPFEIVPGLSSPVAASEFAGIPLTHRDLSSSVTFITGSDQEGKEWSPEGWRRLATATGTICVLMGMRRIKDITQALIVGGRAGSTPAAVVQWGARPEQRTVVGTLETIADEVVSQGLTNPAVIVIGEVVGLRTTLNWYETKPLFGERILVPRARAQAKETTLAIRDLGAQALLAPAIEIHPPSNPESFANYVRGAASYSWVIFTSQNGVDAFFNVVRESKLDARVFGHARIAAIGDKTQKSLLARGIVANLVAEEFIAESLAEALLTKTRPGERVLIPRATEARDVLPQTLLKQGLHVDVAAAYQTLPVEGEARALLVERSREATAILLTSSSMVRSLVRAWGDELALLSEGCVIVCIGPITAQTALELGLRVDVQASRYTVEGALDALVAYRRHTPLTR